MQRLKDQIEESLGPYWGAAAAGIIGLYGLWPVISLYGELIKKGEGGVGWFPFLFVAPFAFLIVVMFMSWLVGGVLSQIDSALGRAFICLALIGLFLLVKGMPSLIGWIVIGLCALSGFVQGNKTSVDARDRRRFFDE